MRETGRIKDLIEKINSFLMPAGVLLTTIFSALTYIKLSIISELQLMLKNNNSLVMLFISAMLYMLLYFPCHQVKHSQPILSKIWGCAVFGLAIIFMFLTGQIWGKELVAYPVMICEGALGLLLFTIGYDRMTVSLGKPFWEIIYTQYQNNKRLMKIGVWVVWAGTILLVMVIAALYILAAYEHRVMGFNPVY